MTDITNETTAAQIDEYAIERNHPVVHIAFGVDQAYVRPVAVTIGSLLRWHPSRQFAFHIFSAAVDEQDMLRLNEMCTANGATIELHRIDPDLFARCSVFPDFLHYSPAIFTRLLMPAALAGRTDRLLYLDADILCVGPLDALFDMPLPETAVAAVADQGKETTRNQTRLLNLRHARYFNSGVLLINVPRWLAADVSTAVVSMIEDSRQPLMFPDQDGLNKVLDGQVEWLDACLNVQYNLDNRLKAGDRKFDLPLKALLLHFTGRVKPWHRWSTHAATELFLDYQSGTPWRDTPLDQPVHYKDMRLAARYALRANRPFSAIRWTAQYLWTKLRYLMQH